MKFNLIDRITELVPGERVTAVKAVTLAEEYLADHFPTFPVLPGVLMIEALIQASMCLVRVTEGFAHSLLVLQEAKNVTYKSFVAPGRVLEVSVEAKKIEAGTSQFVGVGRCGDQEMVKAHWTLRHVNLADNDPAMADLDHKLIATARQQMSLLRGPA
jgi:3-hydroxyacyl-[acyl-carrier-protein] dehydratase